MRSFKAFSLLTCLLFSFISYEAFSSYRTYRSVGACSRCLQKTRASFEEHPRRNSMMVLAIVSAAAFISVDFPILLPIGEEHSDISQVRDDAQSLSDLRWQNMSDITAALVKAETEDRDLDQRDQYPIFDLDLTEFRDEVGADLDDESVSEIYKLSKNWRMGFNKDSTYTDPVPVFNRTGHYWKYYTVTVCHDVGSSSYSFYFYDDPASYYGSSYSSSGSGGYYSGSDSGYYDAYDSGAGWYDSGSDGYSGGYSSGGYSSGGYSSGGYSSGGSSLRGRRLLDQICRDVEKRRRVEYSIFNVTTAIRKNILDLVNGEEPVAFRSGAFTYYGRIWNASNPEEYIESSVLDRSTGDIYDGEDRINYFTVEKGSLVRTHRFLDGAKRSVEVKAPRDVSKEESAGFMNAQLFDSLDDGTEFILENGQKNYTLIQNQKKALILVLRDQKAEATSLAEAADEDLAVKQAEFELIDDKKTKWFSAFLTPTFGVPAIFVILTLVFHCNEEACSCSRNRYRRS